LTRAGSCELARTGERSAHGAELVAAKEVRRDLPRDVEPWRSSAPITVGAKRCGVRSRATAFRGRRVPCAPLRSNGQALLPALPRRGRSKTDSNRG
jgi:hypothetical protein